MPVLLGPGGSCSVGTSSSFGQWCEVLTPSGHLGARGKNINHFAIVSATSLAVRRGGSIGEIGWQLGLGGIASVVKWGLSPF